MDTNNPESQVINRIRISPPVIMRWLTSEAREKRVLLFDMEPDLLDRDTLRVNLNVVFQPIHVRCGLVEQRVYSIGCTGAEIIVKACNGKVKNYTEETSITVNYTNKENYKRHSFVSLSPEVEAGAKARIGEIALKANTERVFESCFSSTEHTLTSSACCDEIKWEMDMPRGEKATRDYLVGNLYLHVECSWGASHPTGYIVIKPKNILFYDHENRPLGSYGRCLVMGFKLWCKNIKVEGRNGLTVHFKQES